MDPRRCRARNSVQRRQGQAIHERHTHGRAHPERPRLQRGLRERQRREQDHACHRRRNRRGHRCRERLHGEARRPSERSQGTARLQLLDEGAHGDGHHQGLRVPGRRRRATRSAALQVHVHRDAEAQVRIAGRRHHRHQGHEVRDRDASERASAGLCDKEAIEKALVGVAGHFDATTHGDIDNLTFETEQAAPGASRSSTSCRRLCSSSSSRFQRAVGVGAKWNKTESKRLADQGMTMSTNANICFCPATPPPPHSRST